jgi:hypothetical protein
VSHQCSLLGHDWGPWKWATTPVSFGPEVHYLRRTCNHCPATQVRSNGTWR